MAIEEHITQLCSELEIENLPKEDHDVYLLPTGEEEFIRISTLDQGVYFDAMLGPCPNERREELMSMLLMSDLFGSGTSHAVLGLDAKGENCTLSYALREASDYRVFYEALEEFLNQVDFWRDEIDEYRGGGGT